MASFGTNRLINQFFAVGAARHVKSIHGSEVKVYAWEAGDVFSLVGMFGPEYMGGKGDVSKKIEEEVRDADSHDSARYVSSSRCVPPCILKVVHRYEPSAERRISHCTEFVDASTSV